MTQKEPNEKELLEILEITIAAEQKAREMCEAITAHTEKWQRRTEAKRAATTQQ